MFVLKCREARGVGAGSMGQFYHLCPLCVRPPPQLVCHTRSIADCLSKSERLLNIFCSLFSTYHISVFAFSHFLIQTIVATFLPLFCILYWVLSTFKLNGLVVKLCTIGLSTPRHYAIYLLLV